jgi:ADP-ribose pyrophosphatase YjhB (NUDIX family)
MKNIYKLPAYVGIVLKKENQILLVQRHNTDWACGYWNFPGGLLEENETLTAAAAREALEEVGVVVNPSDFSLVQVLHVRANDKNTQDIIGIYFMTTTWQGTPTNKEPHRHSNVAWFDSNALLQDITEHALLAIESTKTNKKYSENGWKNLTYITFFNRHIWPTRN